VLIGVLALACLAPGSPGLRAQEPSAPAQEAPAVSLSLSEVLQSALEKNLDIAVRRFDPKVAETRVETQEAVFSPNLEFSAKDGENTQPSSSALSGGTVVTDSDRTFAGTYSDAFKLGSTLQFTLFTHRNSTNNSFSTVIPSYYTQALATYTQPLLRNFGLEVNETQIIIAKNNHEISQWQFRQTVMDTLAAAEAAYYDLNLALMNMKTAEAYLKLAQDFLDQTRIRVRVGTLPPIEITQAEAGVADREGTVIVARSAIRAAEDQLRRLMNIPSDSPLWNQPVHPTDEPQVLDKIVDVDEAIRTAMEKRPDLEQARLDLSSRDADLRYRKNQKLYRLDLIAQYGASGLSGKFLPVTQVYYTADPTPPGCIPLPNDSSRCSVTTDPPDLDIGESYKQVKDRDFSTWSAELQLGIPLGNRAAKAAYAAAKYSEDQAKLTIQQLEQAAQVEVRTAARDIDTNLKRYRAAQVNTRLQTEKLNAEQKKYENGMSTTYQVLQFQTDLTNARARENLAIVDYNKSLVELDRVLGILLDTRNVSVSD
jgi:outer membrane protein TolC